MKTIVLLAASLLLVACGQSKEEPEPGVFDDLTGTIDKAEDVERQVLEQKERLDKALEDAQPEREPPPG